MSGWAGSSSRSRYLRLLGLVVALQLGAACAARRPATVPVTPPPVTERVEAKAPPQPAPPEARAAEFPPLPGTDRVYPSQDPRNQALAGSPEAFPLGGAGDDSANRTRVEPGDGQIPAAAESLDVVTPEEMEFIAGPEPTGNGTTAAEAESAAEPGRDEPWESDASRPAAPASKPDSPAPSATWSVQLLASSSASVARERAAALARYFPEPPRVEPAHGLFRVRVGRCATRGEAEALRRRARAAGFADAFVVPPSAAADTPP